MKLISEILKENLDLKPRIVEMGLNLSSIERHEMRSKLELLAERAPANSSICLSFFKEDLKFKGSLVILCTSKKFESTISGDSPREVYNNLEYSIDQQLVEWKKHRFINDYVSTNLEKASHNALKGGYVR